MPLRPLITRRRVRTLVLLVVLMALGVWAGSWWMAGQLTAPALREVGEGPEDLPIENLIIASKSGSTLAGWYVPSEGNLGTVVLLHAIRGSRLQMLPRARLLHEAGYDVLLVDMQAHGESPGEHVTAGYLERFDAAAAVEFARVRNQGQPIAIIGCSLGGAATLLAAPLPVDAVVLEAVYPTIEEAVDNRVHRRLGPASVVGTPLLLAQLRTRIGIDPAELRPIDHIAKLGCPVLVMTGDGDEHTTPGETERLFAAAAEPKQLVFIAGAEHQDLCHFDPEIYAKAVLPFLAEHMKAP